MGLVDEDRSSLDTPADIRRARERLLAALLSWWEKPVGEEDEDSMDRGTIAEVMRGVIRDASKSSDEAARRERRATKRRKVPA